MVPLSRSLSDRVRPDPTLTLVAPSLRLADDLKSTTIYHMLLLRRASWRMDLTTWILRAGVAGYFVMVGAEKFMNRGAGLEWLKVFQEIGLGEWFRYFTGVVEIAGAVLYLVPQTCLIGAALLSSAMIGAMVFHIAIRHSVGSSFLPLIWLVAIVLVALRTGRDEEPVRVTRGR